MSRKQRPSREEMSCGFNVEPEINFHEDQNKEKIASKIRGKYETN